MVGLVFSFFVIVTHCPILGPSHFLCDEILLEPYLEDQIKRCFSI